MTTPKRSKYPSDLSDLQWERLWEILPPEKNVGRQRLVDLREVASAINYRWETGCVWRMLPHDFPAWVTVYSYFRKWQRAGIIRQLRVILLEPQPKKRFRPQPTSAPTSSSAWPVSSAVIQKSEHQPRNTQEESTTQPTGFSSPLRTNPTSALEKESSSSEFPHAR